MGVLPRRDQAAALGEIGHDLLGRLGRREPMQPAEAIVEPARLVHRHDDGKVVYAGQLEILGAAPRCDVDDAGALIHRDLVPTDDAVLDARRPRAGGRRARRSASR